MKYYVVRAVEWEGGIGPDVPEGTSWVGNPLPGGRYLIKTDADLNAPELPDLSSTGRVPDHVGSPNLEAVCHNHGLPLAAVRNSWGIGGQT